MDAGSAGDVFATRPRVWVPSTMRVWVDGCSPGQREARSPLMASKMRGARWPRRVPVHGSRWTPSAACTWSGASLVHSPIAASDLAPASTAATATASIVASVCRRPRRWRGVGDLGEVVEQVTGLLGCQRGGLVEPVGSRNGG